LKSSSLQLDVVHVVYHFGSVSNTLILNNDIAVVLRVFLVMDHYLVLVFISL